MVTSVSVLASVKRLALVVPAGVVSPAVRVGSEIVVPGPPAAATAASASATAACAAGRRKPHRRSGRRRRCRRACRRSASRTCRRAASSCSAGCRRSPRRWRSLPWWCCRSSAGQLIGLRRQDRVGPRDRLVDEIFGMHVDVDVRGAGGDEERLALAVRHAFRPRAARQGRDGRAQVVSWPMRMVAGPTVVSHRDASFQCGSARRGSCWSSRPTSPGCSSASGRRCSTRRPRRSRRAHPPRPPAPPHRQRPRRTSGRRRPSRPRCPTIRVAKVSTRCVVVVGVVVADVAGGRGRGGSRLAALRRRLPAAEQHREQQRQQRSERSRADCQDDAAPSRRRGAACAEARPPPSARHPSPRNLPPRMMPSAPLRL